MGGGSTKTETKPWEGIRNQLARLAEQTQDYWESGDAQTPFYQGPTYAGLNSTGRQGIQQLLANANTNIAAAGRLGTTGQGLLQQGSQFGANASGLVQQANAGPALSNAQALFNSSPLNPALKRASDVYQSAAKDPTAALIDDAGRYADNQYTNGVIQNAVRDDVRAVTEDALPALNRSAAMGNNLNSSRTGVSEGILKRGLQDRIADVSATVRGDAYNNGLQTALAERGQSLDARLSANGQQAGLANQQLGNKLAANSQLAGITADNFGRALSANQQVGQAYDMGLQGIGTAGQMRDAAAGNQLKAGGLLQADQQGRYDDDFGRWRDEDNRTWDLFNRYSSSLNGTGGQYTSQRGPAAGGNIWGSLIGAAGTLGGAYLGTFAGNPVAGAAIGGALGGAAGGATGGALRRGGAL
ncbi:MAG TPA: hypothetical protein PKA13_08985 [Geminicoccaceae bacterium]|nr:hypothetical protein [Geminicoccaceae bacterium]